MLSRAARGRGWGGAKPSLWIPRSDAILAPGLNKLDKTHPDYKVLKPRPVWERNAQDTNESWPYYKAYRDYRSGVRTLEEARQSPSEDVRRPLTRQGMPTIEQMHRWHSEGQWAMRVAAFDAHLDELQNEERELLFRQAGAIQGSAMAAEHLATLQTTLDIARDQQRKILEAVRSADFATMKPIEVLKYLETAVKLQRLIAGEATERVEETTDLDCLSDEELAAALDAVRAKKK